MSISYEEAKETDVIALSKLGQATFVTKFGHLYKKNDLEYFLNLEHSEHRYSSYLSDPETTVVVARTSNHALVAYSVAGLLELPVKNCLSNSLELKRLYVLSSYQSTGIGSHLMKIFIDWAIRKGNPDLYLGVFSDNTDAQRFYERYGFSRVGEYDFPVGSHIDYEFIYKRKSGWRRNLFTTFSLNF
jgi:ribosomal protein S18 acetylase RimI-like enzyme